MQCSVVSLVRSTKPHIASELLDCFYELSDPTLESERKLIKVLVRKIFRGSGMGSNLSNHCGI